MDFKILDVCVSFDDAYNILNRVIWPLICPGWSGKEILTKTFSAGYVNNVTLYYAADDVDIENGMIVRLNNPGLDISKRKYDEFTYMQISHEAGCFGRVRAVLRNGLIYDYMPGNMLTAAQISHPVIGPKVARAIARFHWIAPDSLQIVDRAGKVVPFSREDNFIKKLREVLDAHVNMQYPPDEASSAKSSINLGELSEEVDYVERYLEGLDLPIATTHDDFHFYNIIYHDKSGKVGIVDYDECGYHAIATNDFGILLNLDVFNTESIRSFSPPDAFPTAPETMETKLMYLKAYLEEKVVMEGGDPGKEISQQVMDLWFTMLEMSDVLFGIQCAIRLLNCIQRKGSTKHLLPFFQVAYQVYRERKPRLPAFRDKYLRQKQAAKQRAE